MIENKFARNMKIYPKFLGKTVLVHNGKLYLKLKIKKEMIGFKFGEFIPTKKTFLFKKTKKK